MKETTEALYYIVRALPAVALLVVVALIALHIAGRG